MTTIMWQVSDEQQNTRTGGGTLSRSSVAGSVNNQGDDVISEMARRLQERRAKTEQVPQTNYNVCTCCVLLTVVHIVW